MLPDSADDVIALFDRLPADLLGRQRVDQSPEQPSDRITADYGATEPVGCGMIGLQAMDLTGGGFFPADWTAERVIAMLATGADWEVEDAGQDGELSWVAVTTTCGAEGSAGEDVIHALNWGVNGGSWVFQAMGDTSEARDQLTQAFVVAAG